MLTATVSSVLVSCVISYGFIAALYGVGGLGEAEPILLILPLLVPALVTPLGTLQMATTLALAAAAVDELSVARTELQAEVAARRAAQLELEFLARRDPLTGVFNRRGFFDALQNLSPQEVSTMVLATVDIDRFKAVNDTFGHAVGDGVLRAVAVRLERAAGPNSIVARLGGDEFVAASFGGADRGRIRTELASFEVNGIGPNTLEVSCSVGVAAHSSGANIEATMAQADASMYHDKSRCVSEPMVAATAGPHH